MGGSYDFKKGAPSSVFSSFDFKKTSSMSKNKIGTIISPTHATIIKYKNLSKQSAIRDDIEFETQHRILTEEDDHVLSVTDKFNKDVLSAGTQRLKENMGT